METKLVKACLKGDRKAQARLYEQNKIYLFGITLRYAKDRAEAEDILQEGFCQIFKDLRSWSGNGPLRAWLRKVIINAALMHIRKFRKMQFTELGDIDFENLEFTDLSLMEKERAQSVIAMIQNLPDPYQTVFNLKAIDGFSYEEISERLNIGEGTLRSHYLRARNKLKIILQKELNSDG